MIYRLLTHCFSLRRLSLLAILLLLSANGWSAEAVKPAVPVVIPARGKITRWVTLPASLRADRQVTLYAKVSGYLKQVLADRGQAVKQGDLLAEIELPEMLADLKRYEAEARAAEQEASRLEAIGKRAPQLVAPQTLENAQSAFQAASASSGRAQAMLGFARITAPFDGIITKRFVDLGAFVPAATAGGAQAALFTLMDFATVRTLVAVPETEVPLIREGLPAKVTVEELPRTAFEGTVTRSSYALDEATRSMVIEVDLPNPERRLRPGMYALAKLGVEEHQDALLVPADAVVMEKTAAYLYKYVDGKAKKSAVTIGFNDGAQAEVLQGLAAGEQVIVTGKLTLADGQEVQPAGPK